MTQTLSSVWKDAVGKDVNLLGLFTSQERVDQYLAQHPAVVLVQGSQEVANTDAPLETGDTTYAVYGAIDPLAFDVQFQLAEVTASRATALALQDQLFQALQEKYGKQDPVFKDEWTIVQPLVVNEPLNPV